MRPLGRQLSPVAPGRRAGQFFVGLLVEGAHLDQARIHPFIEQLDGFALAGAFDAIDQHDHREASLLVQLELRFQQGLTQGRDFCVVSVLIDGVTNFGGFKHGRLPSKMDQD